MEFIVGTKCHEKHLSQISEKNVTGTDSNDTIKSTKISLLAKKDSFGNNSRTSKMAILISAAKTHEAP